MPDTKSQPAAVTTLPAHPAQPALPWAPTRQPAARSGPAAGNGSVPVRAPWSRRHLLATGLAGACSASPWAWASAPAADAAGSFARHPEALALARQLDAENAWSDGYAAHWIGQQARHRPQIVRLMTPLPQGTARDWPAYRARFVEPRRIQAGLRFWRAQRAALARCEREFGVPPWLVVGIIGVETLYGQHMGRHRVLDALATLAFDFPPMHPRAAQRTAFFRSELGAFLRLSRAHQRAPDAWLGSFAGAIGLPQFMPSNWPRFGVDFDGDGRVDLIHSAPDAIGSVGRFLHGYGWVPGQPTHFALRFEPGQLDLPALLAPSIRPSFDLERLQALGVRPEAAALQHSGLLALVELEQGTQPPGYWLGTHNFFAISRYNPSSYYVMAVIDLGHAVQAALERA